MSKIIEISDLMEKQWTRFVSSPSWLLALDESPDLSASSSIKKEIELDNTQSPSVL